MFWNERNSSIPCRRTTIKPSQLRALATLLVAGAATASSATNATARTKLTAQAFCDVSSNTCTASASGCTGTYVSWDWYGAWEYSGDGKTGRGRLRLCRVAPHKYQNRRRGE